MSAPSTVAQDAPNASDDSGSRTKTTASADPKSRAERREEIKLVVEYIKLVLSLGTIGAVVVAALQWRDAQKQQTTATLAATQAATEATYERLSIEWRDNLRALLEKPALRPYFEDGKPLDSQDPLAQQVMAFADMRLDVMDAVLTYPAVRGLDTSGMVGWRKTFSRAFRASPVLCQRLVETHDNFGLIVIIGMEACNIPAKLLR